MHENRKTLYHDPKKSEKIWEVTRVDIIRGRNDDWFNGGRDFTWRVAWNASYTMILVNADNIIICQIWNKICYLVLKEKTEGRIKHTH